MGKQQAAFPVVSLTTAAQKDTMEYLNVVVNHLGYEVIEIELVNPKVQEITGVKVVKYRTPNRSIEQITQQLGHMPSAQELYPHKITGGSLKFSQSPYPRMPLATGLVAFVLDDQEEVPRAAKSGAKTGWNREFLASHYHAGYWKIVDGEIDDEIRRRADRIQESRPPTEKVADEVAVPPPAVDTGQPKKGRPPKAAVISGGFAD